MTVYYECSRELYHHGVKGMHWGVRRYQNEDGSLTTAGLAKQASRRKENGLATRAELGVYAIKKHKYDEGKKLRDSDHKLWKETAKYTAVTGLSSAAMLVGQNYVNSYGRANQALGLSMMVAGATATLTLGQKYAQRMGYMTAYYRGDPSLSRKAKAALDRERNRR